jgi:hypothetical protein
VAGGDVIELPVGLAPWATELAILPSDLALALAPWVGRLALAVGQLASLQSRHGGEPDGYSGLSRRGSYERLVTAEWGIAELFPDEFVRRAAMGEHLFLDLARREPHGALRSIAIVSAGPAQLGAPRLAHVAALIVLARRAAVAGAGFSWGVLEDREHRLSDGLDEAGIDRLLRARTAIPASAGALDGWLDASGRDAMTDFWFIGADEDAARAVAVGASSMVARDLLEPNTRALEVDIERRGLTTRLRLELPAPDQCARLLRDPFARGHGVRKTVSAKGPAHDVRFAAGARRLIVRLADGSFESWPLPSSPRDLVGNPRTWTPPRNHSVLAVGIGRRSILAVTATRDDPTAIELSYSNNHRVRVMVPKAVASELARRLVQPTPPPLGACALVRLRTWTKPDLIIEILGSLLVIPELELWPERGTVLTALPFNSRSGEAPPLVVATAFFGTRFVWAEQHDNGQIYVMEATSSGNERVAIVGARAEPDAHFGFSMPPSDTWGVVSVAWDNDHRRVAAPKLEPMTIQAAVPVVGVGLRDGSPALLTRPNPYRLAWVSSDPRKMFHREMLPTAGVAIAAVAVCSVQPHVAWITEAGEVVVYSMHHKAVLLRRAPGASE